MGQDAQTSDKGGFVHTGKTSNVVLPNTWLSGAALLAMSARA
jgi:hypothetical protein